ncbi:uncharacterized protein LOC135119074 [Helicoverpa armigera]|uniref:uncharacterized protein LOC135119074 n=1 Tax=Helicoverpa armigera TaxID=29058 RepID=UPI003083C784
MSASKKSMSDVSKPPKVKKYKMMDDIKVIQESSSDSSGHGTVCYGVLSQEHARPRIKAQKSSVSRMSIDEASSNASLSSSITRFRGDFDTFKCKMRIFGESLNLCRCIADDFRSRLSTMEKRLDNLEKRQRLYRSASNYSAIIQKNKLLSYKCLKEMKVSI